MAKRFLSTAWAAISVDNIAEAAAFKHLPNYRERVERLREHREWELCSKFGRLFKNLMVRSPSKHCPGVEETELFVHMLTKEDPSEQLGCQANAQMVYVFTETELRELAMGLRKVAIDNDSFCVDGLYL